MPSGVIIIIAGSKPGAGSELLTASIVNELGDHGLAVESNSDEEFHVAPASCALCESQDRNVALFRFGPESFEVTALTRAMMAAADRLEGSKEFWEDKSYPEGRGVLIRQGHHVMGVNALLNARKARIWARRGQQIVPPPALDDVQRVELGFRRHEGGRR